MENIKIPWVLVSGDFTRTGGMDRANYHLAWYLADQLDYPVHIVAFRVVEPLLSHSNVVFHRVSRPFGSHSLGEILLRRCGRRIAQDLTRQNPRTRVVVNGGNGDWPDINWVHMVHHASACQDEGAPWWFRLRNRWVRYRCRVQEKKSLRSAKTIIANSNKTQADLVAFFDLEPCRIRRVYLGVDPQEFNVPASGERTKARSAWKIPADGRVALFVGVIGYDRNKGLDTLLAALRLLREEQSWLLLVAGHGSLPYWQAIIERLGLASNVRLIGHTAEIASLMAAADLLVSPTRYDSYGLAVHEANCRGLPAIVSKCAGVAERYPEDLRDLLLDNPDNPEELAHRMRLFGDRQGQLEQATRVFGAHLRSHTWNDMAAQIVESADRF